MAELTGAALPSRDGTPHDLWSQPVLCQGQANHFIKFAPEEGRTEYAQKRYLNETKRLYSGALKQVGCSMLTSGIGDHAYLAEFNVCVRNWQRTGVRGGAALQAWQSVLSQPVFSCADVSPPIRASCSARGSAEGQRMAGGRCAPPNPASPHCDGRIALAQPDTPRLNCRVLPAPFDLSGNACGHEASAGANT